VPVAALPGGSTGISAMFNGSNDAPRPTASVQPAAADPRATIGKGGLDDWLLGKLFGKR